MSQYTCIIARWKLFENKKINKKTNKQTSKDTKSAETTVQNVLWSEKTKVKPFRLNFTKDMFGEKKI